MYGHVCNDHAGGPSMYIYPGSPSRLFFEWFFRKDYCFSRDLQSTIQGDYSFYGLGLPGYMYNDCIRYINTF